MILAISAAVMAMACRCIGETRRDWAQAMRAEFDVAAADGRALSFSVGCLWGALRQLPAQEEGRFVLTNYALVLGIMMPMAAVQVGCAIFGLPYLFPGEGGLRGTLVPVQEVLFGGAYRAAVPVFAALLLLSGVGQLRVAWLMLEHAWSRAVSTGMATLAVLTTLTIFMGALFLNARQAVLLGAISVIELAVVAGLARWSADLRLPVRDNSIA